MGFSIAEIKEMLFNNDGNYKIDIFSQRISQIDEEIKKLQLMKKNAEAWKKRLEEEDIFRIQNENFNVLKTDGETPINNLYAVGTDSMGVLFTEKKPYVSFY